ncbi:hypothetical protein L873DRAFT_1107837 [Choiromyces venosus 120613-1]|uniref:F-box domain-containing protein n=1 Tax=Choiromyces venosus 120613-1 TaxID=1336337 RepID=A0A3N4JH04_9PEZI|nr:hypothetical protein L873DRAFT_1107837 [Choiromyces venosus 120613-1]
MPTPQTLSSQQAGRSAYASGDFAAALSHFTSALSQPNIPLSLRVQILDHLSATREKLQDLPGALADARCIMRLRPTAVEGYLRGGKILQLLGRQDDALRLYLYGLDKLPAGGDGGRVRAQVDKLRARIAGKKCEEERGRRRDPFEILPIEVAVLVLAHLPFRTLMLARAVSKGWKGVIEAAPRTFSEVDFTEARRGVTPAAFKAIVNASRGGVRIARISKLAGGGGKTTSGLLGYLVRRARRLMTLEVYRSGEVDTALVEVVREGVTGLKLPALITCILAFGSLRSDVSRSPRLPARV